MTNLRPAGPNSIREINIAVILRLIHEQAPIARARLAALTGLNKSTVSSLVEELLDRRLVHETGTGSSLSGQGRPSTLLEINPQAGGIAGVELGVDYIRAVLIGLTGELLWRETRHSDPNDPQEHVLAVALELARAALAFARGRGLRMLGVGLALPGMVDVDSGVLRFSPNLQWRDVPMRRMFQEALHLPVFVDNDANCGALGEHLFGAARHCRNFIFLVAGIGIGGGLFLNGELYRGAGGLAGELGHTQVFSEQTRLCRCGIRGCWENSGNQYALIERVRARLDVGRRSLIPSLLAEQGGPASNHSQLTLGVIARAAELDDPEALGALHETGLAIGAGVANLINTFNPERVVISGGMSLVSEYMLPGILEVVKEKTLPETFEQASVVLSEFGGEAGVIGAAALVVEAVLANPTYIQRDPTAASPADH